MLWMSPARVFQLHIVVEFDRQDVNIGEGLYQLFVPAAQVGGIAKGPAVACVTGGPFKTEAKRCTAVVTQRQRPAAQAGGQRPFPVLLKMMQQPFRLQSEE